MGTEFEFKVAGRRPLSCVVLRRRTSIAQFQQTVTEIEQNSWWANTVGSKVAPVEFMYSIDNNGSESITKVPKEPFEALLLRVRRLTMNDSSEQLHVVRKALKQLAVHDLDKHLLDVWHKYWRLAFIKGTIRNPSYSSQGGFWLPKSPGRFFPDFIVELKSGQVVLVEYKNSKLAAHSEEQHKRAVGELWEARSDGQCRFAWVIDRDWGELASKLNA